MSYKSVREILNSVFDSDDHALKTIFKTDGEVLNMVLDESGDPALKVRMDGSAGSGLTDEEKTALAKASKNYLINPFEQAFCINQRCYVSGTVVSGGTYMYDRWKASGGDASITFDGEYYSISGTIEQVIESPALSGQTVLLSGDTGGTTVECEVDGQTGTLPMTVTISGTGHIPVKLTGGKVKNVKLGFNDIYIALDYCTELTRSRRYYEKSYDLTVSILTASFAGALTGNASSSSQMPGFRFQVHKRTVPAVTLYSVVAPAPETVRHAGTNIAASPGGSGQSGISYINLSGAVPGAITFFHFTADAEL